MISVISSAIGAGSGILQNYLQNKQQAKLQLELAKIQQSTAIQTSQDSVAIAQAGSDEEDNRAETARFEAIEASSVMLADSQYLLTRVQNFLVNTTRPILTYLMFFFVVFVTCKMMKAGLFNDSKLLLAMFDLILAEFSGITSYWFVRRSYEKTLQPLSNSTVKKNSENIVTRATQQTLKVNFTAKELIKKYEGCELKAYKCPAGKWTIGYGNTSLLRDKSDAECKNYTITQAQAEELFEEDYNHHRELLEKVIIHILDTLTENQIGALTSFVFNVGIKAFARSTLLKEIRKNPNNRKAIEKEFGKWIYADGKKFDGLIKRRRDEVALYFS